MNEKRNTLTKRIEIRLDPDTLQELERLAAREDRTAASVARRLIRVGLKAEEGAAA